MDVTSKKRAFASSGSEKAKKGGNWQYKIYFDPEADDDGAFFYDDIKDEELLTKLIVHAGNDDDIENVWAYKVPLSEKQLTQFLLFHMYIVFETKGWFWSIEKHSDGITIQRSQKMSAVKERYRRKERNSRVTLMEQDKGKMSVCDVIDWLYKNGELRKQYDYITSNCQHFAKAVFNHVAMTRTL